MLLIYWFSVTLCLVDRPHPFTWPVSDLQFIWLTGMASHPPIPIVDLADHLERLKANDNLKFSQEYEASQNVDSAVVINVV